MRCEEVHEQLAAFVDGELPAADADAITVHLDGCLACQVDHVAMKQGRDRIASLPREKAPAALAAGVAARIGVRADGSAPAAKPDHHASHHPTEGLSAFLDNELEPAERDTMREHIGSCDVCSEALVALDDLVGRVRTLPRKSAPGELVGRILERIGPQIITPQVKAARAAEAAAEAAEAAVQRAARPRTARLAADRTAPDAQGAQSTTPLRAASPVRPFELGPGAKRFLSAASVLLLALGSIAFATPNTSSEPMIYGPGDEYRVVGHAPQGPREGPKPPPPPKPRIDQDRTFALLCANVDTAPTTLVNLGNANGFAATQVPQQSAPTWTVSGPPASLQVLAVRGGEVSLEDPAAFARVVPPPLDKVQLRSGETYGGKLIEDNKARVVLATATSTGAPSAAAKPLRLEFPRRSVVKVVKADCNPVAVHVVLKSRSD